MHGTRLLKNGCRCFFILLCLGALISYGIFSVSGFLGAILAVTALPVPPVRALWKKILPADSPRFAKEAILMAAFLVMMAAAPRLPGANIPTSYFLAQEPTVKTAAPSASQDAETLHTPAPAANSQMAEAPVQAASDVETGELQSDIVYIASSGKGSKYHRDPQCSSMQNPIEMTKAEAESQGYTPCQRCCGN